MAKTLDYKDLANSVALKNQGKICRYKIIPSSLIGNKRAYKTECGKIIKPPKKGLPWTCPNCKQAIQIDFI